jgi:hypothetical protein
MEYLEGLANDSRTRIDSHEYHLPENPMSLLTSLPTVDSA